MLRKKGQEPLRKEKCQNCLPRHRIRSLLGVVLVLFRTFNADLHTLSTFWRLLRNKLLQSWEEKIPCKSSYTSSYQSLGRDKMMLSESYSTYARNSFAYLQHNKLSVLTILLFPLFRYAYLDYQGWYALGGGGIPHNVFGWLVQSLLRLRASRNVRDSTCYDVAMKATELERTSFLDDQLPAWTGNAPKTGVWVAPHRQLEQFASSEIKKVGIFFCFFFVSDQIVALWPKFLSWLDLSHIWQALQANLSHINDSNPGTFELGPSQIEGGAPALFISPKYYNTDHGGSSFSPREVFHSHCEAEGSSHAILSAADAKQVLDKGWGERHGISGKGLNIPLGYVMIFAPRSMQEVEVVGRIARAAARYGLEGKTIH